MEVKSAAFVETGNFQREIEIEFKSLDAKKNEYKEIEVLSENLFYLIQQINQVI